MIRWDKFLKFGSLSPPLALARGANHRHICTDSSIPAPAQIQTLTLLPKFEKLGLWRSQGRTGKLNLDNFDDLLS